LAQDSLSSRSLIGLKKGYHVTTDHPSKMRQTASKVLATQVKTAKGGFWTLSIKYKIMQSEGSVGFEGFGCSPKMKPPKAEGGSRGSPPGY
jgi:hypothetical protein